MRGKSGLITVLAMQGCLLVISEPGEDPSPVVSPEPACGEIEPAGLVELTRTAPFDRTDRNLVGQRRFVVADGQAFVATPDGRLLSADLRDPRQPQVNDDWMAPDGVRLVRLAVDGGRLFALAERVDDGGIELFDLGASPADAVARWELGGRLGSGLHLSAALGCVFAGSGFSDTFVYSIDGGAPQPADGLGGRLAVDTSGLGAGVLNLLRVAEDGSCRVELLGLLGSEGELAAAERDRVWLVADQTFSVRTVDANEGSVPVRRRITDLTLIDDLVIVGADRDVLVYRRVAPNVPPTPSITIPMTGRVLAVARVFRDDDRWLAVLVADEAIENDTAFMSVVTFDLEDLCP